MKKTLKEYIDNRELQRSGGAPESASFHSKGYHKYFEGYSEYKETLPNGKIKIRRIYTGVYHRAELTNFQRIALRLSYCLLYLLSAILFFYGVTRPVGSNTCIYVTIPEAVSILGFLWVFYCLVNYLSAPCNMTVYEYKSIVSFKKSLSFLSRTLLVTVFLTLVYTFLNIGQYIIPELICSAVILLSAGSCFLILTAENRIAYTSFLSQNQAPEDSNQIDS